MKVHQSGSFKRKLKKLPIDHKPALDRAVKKIVGKPNVGVLKKGDLAGVRVYKFKVKTLQYLLAYAHDSENEAVTLLALGPHENFYRDLKNQ